MLISILFCSEKVATPCRCISIDSPVLVSGQRPAPPWFRLPHSSEERRVLQSEVPAKAAAAVGMAVVLKPL